MQAARTAREFTLSEHDGLVVPLADPFDLLANKIAIGREKDRPHIELLRQFCEEEVVEAFAREEGRQRLMPARRLLEIVSRRTLPEELADRLIELAERPIDFRFLMSKVPAQRQVRRLLGRLPDRPEGGGKPARPGAGLGEAQQSDSGGLKSHYMQ
ncbi:MAG: hypothetical protein GY856_46115 [bacterium]|nr:hypothetical protein [bacterium]